jgi:CubicO group peptidase (beta-lactamase class C family)
MTASANDVAGRVRDLIEHERKRFETPGLSVAIVRDGQVVFAEGFGLRQVDAALPVTADTLFPIASITKSFTAALVGLCVQEGLLEWDRPVREYAPWFRLHDPVASDQTTVRDLLSHRTGLPRHDFAWIGQPDFGRRELIERLRHLQPSKPFRAAWQYNNLAYVTAGFLAGEAQGTGYEQAVQERLLAPLGMDRSTLSTDDYIDDADRAHPYDLRDDEVRPAGFRERGERVTAPAGAIISTASEMASWALANLRAIEDGGPLLTRATLRELHRPAMVTESLLDVWPEKLPVGYALGWSVEAYRGHRVVEHGGNIEGISTQLHLFPDDGLGVVVLTNLGGIGLRDAVPYLVADALLDLEPLPWGERYHEAWTSLKRGMTTANRRQVDTAKAVPATHPLSAYAGAYVHPTYGRFGVSFDGDRLVPHYHGLGNLDLTHRHHDVFNLYVRSFDVTLPLAFRTGFDGEIEALVVAFEAQVDPIVFRREPDPVDPEQLARLVGRYAMGPFDLVVERHGEALVADAGTAGRFELESRRGLVFAVQGQPNLIVEFVVTDDGAVDRVIVSALGVFTAADAQAG